MTTRSRWLFLLFLALLAIQRLAEVRRSRRNEARMLAQGGREVAPGQWRMMRLLHPAWFAAMLAEVFGMQRRFRPWLAAGAAALFLAGQALRQAAIRTLGPRWSVKIITLPGAEPVSDGIYRWVRHPNYLGVMLEVAAVPLLHSAGLTALSFSIANAALLARRIQAEEQALAEQNGYGEIFAGRPRLLPKIRPDVSWGAIAEAVPVAMESGAQE